MEGLCHSYRTNLYRNVRFLDYPTNNQKCLLPCTALSVVKIIESCPGCYDFTKPVGRKLEGKTVTVINRSEIVGRPLAAMLANDGADVYSVDINSIYMFREGRLHACDDSVTPESCVRKVRNRNKKWRIRHDLNGKCCIKSSRFFQFLLNLLTVQYRTNAFLTKKYIIIPCIYWCILSMILCFSHAFHFFFPSN